MSNQYIFFDETLSERFIACARDLGIAGSMRPDEIEGMLVELPDDLPDEILESLEVRYDALMDEQREMIDALDEAGSGVKMGVEITLPDGEPCMVSLPAALGRRLVEHFSAEEIHALVTAIAENVVDPSMAPLCCRP